MSSNICYNLKREVENMSKNKGFTLVELLAVLAILATIMTIAVTSVTSVLNKNREKLAEKMESDLSSAAIAYIEDKHWTLAKCTSVDAETQSFSPASCYKEVAVKDIIDSGLFTDDEGYCDSSAKVWIYKENLGTYSELKAYVKKGTCE